MEQVPTLWAIKHKLKTEKGDLLDFYDHLFMWDIWNALATEPLLCAMKAAQITFSTTCIMLSFYVAKKLRMDGIYTLPTGTERDEFVGDKVNRIILQNPLFQEYTEDKDTVYQKKVGANMLHYRSTWAEKNATTVSSDVNYYDEVDTSNIKVIGQYATRLQHSKYKWERFFSHPSAEDTGVHNYWNKSTQNHWFIKCSHCKKEQYLSWSNKQEDSSIDVEKQIFICKHCKGELSNEDRRNGRWIAKFKKSETRPFVGYWIPLLICPWVSAKEILKYKEDKGDEYFYNKVLGLPYSGGSNKLTKSKFEQNLTQDMLYPLADERIILGVDTGLQLHYVIGSDKGLPYYGFANDYDELDQLMERWPKMVAVVDQGGDIIGSRKFKETWKGRVWLCSYGEDRKTNELVRWNDKDGSVIADRNRILTLIVEEFGEKRIPVQGEPDEWYDYWLHWKALTRKTEEDDKGKKRYVWYRNGADHWAHATAYWRSGLMRFSSDKGSIIRPVKSTSKLSYEINPDGTTDMTYKQLIKRATAKPRDWRKLG